MGIVCVARDGSEGRQILIGEQTLEIGRVASIPFPHDQFISPRHCRVQRSSNGGLHLEDLGSRNGVYVRILRTEQVYPGDVFLLGHQLLRLENLPSDRPLDTADAEGTRAFGTPLQAPWGMLVQLGVGEKTADHYYLRESRVVFGREHGDVIFPRDNFMSRQHAQLRMELGSASVQVLLEDLGSANGTYVRMRKTAELEVGDMFRVGDQIFKVSADCS